MKHLEVVAAILEYDGKILCMERGQGKFDYVSFKYEFPGGKIEPGEAKHTAIERELREEMDVHVSVKESDLYMTVHHDYPDFSMTMYAFYCHLDKPDFCPQRTRRCEMDGSRRHADAGLGTGRCAYHEKAFWKVGDSHGGIWDFGAVFARRFH